MSKQQNSAKHTSNKTDKKHFVNSIGLNPKKPIPIEYGGDSFSYNSSGKKYIPFIGQDDNFANLLLEARLTSPTHGECIRTIVNSTIGNGLIVLDKNPEQLNKRFMEWVACVNNDNENLNTFSINSCDGERSNGNQFIEVVRGKIGKLPFLKLYNHPIMFCRLGEKDPKIGKAKSVIISNSFVKKGYISTPSGRNEIPLYDPNALDKNSCWKKTEDGNERTIIHFKNNISGVQDYGLPASISSLRFQVLEGKSAQYNLDMFQNNLVMSGALVFKSAMTQDEARVNAQSILESHTGEGNQGRLAVLSSENGIEDFSFIKYDTQKEGSFIELDKLCEKKIVTSHGWASEFITTSEGSLGKGEGYLRSLWDLKESTTIKPYQKRFIDSVINPIAKIWADWYGEKEVADYKFTLKSSMPFSFMGDLKPEQFMKVNEARILAGLESDTGKEGVYISEIIKQKANVSD